MIYNIHISTEEVINRRLISCDQDRRGHSQTFSLMTPNFVSQASRGL